MANSANDNNIYTEWIHKRLLALVAQLDVHPAGDKEVAGSTPAEVGSILSWKLVMKHFLQSFSLLLIQDGQYWLTT